MVAEIVVGQVHQFNNFNRSYRCDGIRQRPVSPWAIFGRSIALPVLGESDSALSNGSLFYAALRRRNVSTKRRRELSPSGINR